MTRGRAAGLALSVILMLTLVIIGVFQVLDDSTPPDWGGWNLVLTGATLGGMGALITIGLTKNRTLLQKVME